jgi:iron complex transport system permease protein
MKILIDVDTLEQEGVLTSALAVTLRKHAVRDTGSTAINLLLAFGAVVVAAGAGALFPSPTVALLFGTAFIVAGWYISSKNQEQRGKLGHIGEIIGMLIVAPFTLPQGGTILLTGDGRVEKPPQAKLVDDNHPAKWGKLGSIWMIIGTLITAGALAMLVGYTAQGDVVVEHPLLGSLVAAIVLAGGAWLAQSRLLASLVPLAISSAIGGYTGYWHATYMVCVREPTITILVFTALGLASWLAVQKLKGAEQALMLTFTRMCVILVNFGFWIGSLWGDTPGALWRGTSEPAAYLKYIPTAPTIPATSFIVGWAVALLVAGAWGAHNGRRFLVNTVAVFGAIHFYTQWFEHLGADPLSVMIAGAATIGFGLALWKYNQKQIGG